MEAGLARAGRTESKTKPSPKCARSAASHFALDEMISDFSIERSASCVPITYLIRVRVRVRVRARVRVRMRI